MIGIINWLAVLIAAVVNVILGMVWYGPILGKAWIKAVGIPKKKLDKLARENMHGKMTFSFLAGLVMAIVLNITLPVSIISLKLALIGTLILWVGLIVTTSLNYVLWEGKSLKLYLINIGYYLVSMSMMTTILILMS